MTNQNGGEVHPLTATPLSPSQQLRLRAYHESMYGILDDYLPLNQASSFSPLSDLQNLESNFRRLGVSDLNARQQQLLSNNRLSSQFPLEARDQSMISVREYFNPSYGRSNSGAMGSMHTGFNGNFGDVSFSPSYRLVDQSPWGYSHGYVPGTRTNHDSYTMISDSRATMLSRAKDRVESLQLQSMIDEGSRETIDKIFGDLISHVCELMIDPFGHQVFRKLLEKCTEEQITQILGMVIQQPIQFVRICGDSNGTRAIKDLMRCLCSEEQISRFMVTLSHVAILLTKSTNANNVILFCFSHFSPSQISHLLRVIAQNCYQIAIDQYGCCMLQQCIAKSSREIRDPLIREIITNSLSLCVNCYGNYVVQYVLELEDCEVADALSRYLDGNYVQLSCDKYGSHAVQKFLKNRQFNSRRIVKELLCDIDSLLVNPYGNYVIQTAWSVSQDDMQNELLYHINRNHPFMRCNRYGRKVLEKLKIWT